MESGEFQRELERRLGILDDPEYPDPARAELPARDLIALLTMAVIVIAALLTWCYPW